MQVKCSYDKLVSLKDLKPHPKNRNKHSKDQIQRLAKIIEYQGIRRPIRVSKRSGFITAGHGLLLAAKKLKLKELPTNFQDYDSDEQEYSDIIADNAIASWAELDLESINLDVPDLGPDYDIDWLGIKDFAIDASDKYSEEELEKTPEPRKTDIQLGDLFTLGKHRLLCGDSTDKASVDLLMDGQKADMVFTDPPYGIGYEYNSHDDTNPEDNKQMVSAALLAHDCGKVWTPGKMNLERDLSRFGKAKIAIWYKKFAQAGSGLGGASTFEPILILNPKEKKLKNDVIVLATERETLNGISLRDLHSCPKPVALYNHLIEAFTSVSDKIAEPFCGSGTTLIACENTGRQCFGMELDPTYCQVIIDRWELLTGQKAVKIENSVLVATKVTV